MTRALVLSGGGPAGAAWMAGAIDALREEGVDLGAADLTVGTSAGARTATQLATGLLDRTVAMYRRGEAPNPPASATLDAFVGAAMRIAAEAGDPREAARRLATVAPLGPSLVSDADRRSAFAAMLPVDAWPEQRLVITAVDAESGERAAFDAGSGVELLDAVMASGALPGIFELTSIAGRRYADGGVHSVYNADLAAGHEVVVVLTPIPIDAYRRSLLDAETAALGDASVHVVVADDASLAAIGPDPLAVDTGAAAVEAGAAQARREVEALRAVWK